VKDAVVQGMLLDPAVPCETSFAAVGSESIRYAVAHGEPGIADVTPGDGIRAHISEDEAGRVTAWTNKTIPLGYEVPIALRRGMQIKVEGLVVNDSHVLVLSLGNGKDEYRILVFRKSDK